MAGKQASEKFLPRTGYDEPAVLAGSGVVPAKGKPGPYRAKSQPSRKPGVVKSRRRAMAHAAGRRPSAK